METSGKKGAVTPSKGNHPCEIYGSVGNGLDSLQTFTKGGRSSFSELNRACGGSGSTSSKHTLLGKDRRGGKKSISRSSHSSLHLCPQGLRCFLYGIWSTINPFAAAFHRGNEKTHCGRVWGWLQQSSERLTGITLVSQGGTGVILWEKTVHKRGSKGCWSF